MPYYRFRLTPRGSWATPWHADSIFGALCWAWRDTAGEPSLMEFLAEYQANRPPLVISNAFPGRYLPFPFGGQADTQPGEKIKPAWIAVDAFISWAEGKSRTLTIERDVQKPFRWHAMPHAQINRNSNTTEGGELFELDQAHLRLDCLSAPDRCLSVYLHCDEWLLDQVRRCWQSLAAEGFGRKASSGLGAFDVEPDVEQCPWLVPGKHHNAFVALGHFLPAAQDPVDGAWRLHTTNPKFSGNRVVRYLKGNLICLSAGSTFRPNGELKRYYGRILPVPTQEFPLAVHYGLCLPAPVTLPGPADAHPQEGQTP